MEQILKYTIEVDGRNADAVIQSTTSKMSGVGKGAAEMNGEIESGAQKGKSSLEAFDQQLGKFQSTMLGMGAMATVAFTAPIVGVLALGNSFNAMEEQAQIAFTTLLGSAQKAQSFLDEMKDFAAATPFEYPDLIRAAQRMMAMGFAAESVKPMLTAIGDAVAAMGGNSVMIDRVVLALGQMSSQGRVMAGEMRQLTEAGIPAWHMLAEKMGMSVGHLQDLVSKGVVPAKAAIELLVQAMNERFGGSMERQAQSFTGLVSTIADKARFLAGDLEKGFFQALKAPLQGAIEIMDAVSVELNAMGDGTKTAIVVVGLMVAAIGPLLLILGTMAGAVSNMIVLWGLYAGATATASAANVTNATTMGSVGAGMGNTAIATTAATASMGAMTFAAGILGGALIGIGVGLVIRDVLGFGDALDKAAIKMGQWGILIHASRDANHELGQATQKLADDLKNKYGEEILRGADAVDVWNKRVVDAYKAHQALDPRLIASAAAADHLRAMFVASAEATAKQALADAELTKQQQEFREAVDKGKAAMMGSSQAQLVFIQQMKELDAEGRLTGAMLLDSKNKLDDLRDSHDPLIVKMRERAALLVAQGKLTADDGEAVAKATAMIKDHIGTAIDPLTGKYHEGSLQAIQFQEAVDGLNASVSKFKPPPMPIDYKQITASMEEYARKREQWDLEAAALTNQHWEDTKKKIAEAKETVGNFFARVVEGAKDQSLLESFWEQAGNSGKSMLQRWAHDLTATLFGPAKQAFDDFFNGLLESSGIRGFFRGLGSKIGSALAGLFGGGSGGDVLSQLGNIALPGVDGAAGQVLLGGAGAGAGGILGLGTWGGGATGGGTGLMGGMHSLLANPWTAAVAAGIMGVVALVKSQAHHEANTFVKDFQNPFGAGLGNIVTPFNTAVQSGNMTEAGAIAAKEAVVELWAEFKHQADEFAKKGSDAALVVQQAYATMTQHFGTDLSNVTNAMDAVIKDLGAAAARQQRLVEIEQELATVRSQLIDALRQKLSDLDGEIKASEASIAQWGQDLEDLSDSILENRRLLEDATYWENLYNDSIRDSFEELQRITNQRASLEEQIGQMTLDVERDRLNAIIKGGSDKQRLEEQIAALSLAVERDRLNTIISTNEDAAAIEDAKRALKNMAANEELAQMAERREQLAALKEQQQQLMASEQQRAIDAVAVEEAKRALAEMAAAQEAAETASRLEQLASLKEQLVSTIELQKQAELAYEGAKLTAAELINTEKQRMTEEIASKVALWLQTQQNITAEQAHIVSLQQQQEKYTAMLTSLGVSLESLSIDETITALTARGLALEAERAGLESLTGAGTNAAAIFADLTAKLAELQDLMNEPPAPSDTPTRMSLIYDGPARRWTASLDPSQTTTGLPESDTSVSTSTTIGSIEITIQQQPGEDGTVLADKFLNQFLAKLTGDYDAQQAVKAAVNQT